MSGPGFLESLGRAAHEIRETAGAAKDEIVSMVEAAPSVVRAAPGAIATRAAAAAAAGRHLLAQAPAAASHALHAVEEAPGALARSGSAAIHRMLTPVAPHPAATHPAAHPAAHPAPAHGPALPKAQSVADDTNNVEISGVPFLRRMTEHSAVAPSDVVQGQLNDCWLLAALASMARANPASITQLIRTIGEGLYEVTLYTAGPDGTPVPRKIVVNDRFPADENHHARGARPDVRGRQGSELWVLLIEKAMAVVKGGYDGLEALNHGLTARLTSGLDLLQGKGEVERFLVANLSEDEVLEHVSSGFAQHRPMTTLSLATPYSARLGVETFHHYSVAAVDPHARTISLQNPWGDHHVPNMKIADFVIVFESLELGPRLA